MPQRRGRGRLLRAAVPAALCLALCGCTVLDSLPLPSSGGGGRPESEVRRARQSAASSRRTASASRLPQEREAPAEPAPASVLVREGEPAFNARSGAEALALARRLDPASQSLRSFADLAGPLRQNLDYLSRQRQNAPALVQPTGSLTWGQLAATARELLELLPALDADPGLLAERFVWYELAPRPVATGYFSPELEASLTRQPGFEHPLYAPPPDLRQADAQEERQGRPKAYRSVGGAILPYHERRAIDLEGVLAGQGLEIAWLRSPVDVFVLQTEGAGTLLLPDGSRQGVQFAAGNGQSFTGLGQLLEQAGGLPSEARGRAAARAWCEAAATRCRELLAGNRSYVFFQLRQGGSLGALEKPLTALVSLATDPSLLPLGAVAALDVPLPGRGGEPSSLRGLALAQDTGSDIRGHRLDVYLGSGERAERLESGLRASAGLHLLVSKNALRARANTRGQ